MNYPKEFFKLPDVVYDNLKWITMVFLPALAAFYLTMGNIIGLPEPDKVAATITALVVFLGIFLQIKSANFRFNHVIEKGAKFAQTTLRFLMSNAIYDNLKWIASILLPALSVLYIALADIWNLPYSTEVSSIITAIVMLLSALLQLSSLEYRTAMCLVKKANKETTTFQIKMSGFLAMDPPVYDFLKFLVQAILPGLATFYVTIAYIWGLPYAEEVGSTIMALVAFIAALMQISTAKYNMAIRKLKSR